ncbi:MAG: amidohydrolase family protein [Opitutaceae bacterium]
MKPSGTFEALTRTLSPDTGPVWLHVGMLFCGRDASVWRDGHVVYDRTKILHAGTTPPRPELLKPGQTQPDAWLPDHTLLPGLIDSHTHLFLEGGEMDPQKRAHHLNRPASELLPLAEARLSRLVSLGIAAVREAGDKAQIGLSLQARWRSSRRGFMPYLDAPGAAIHHRGRYGSFMALPMEDHGTPAATVQDRVAQGAHRIKLLATGIINFEKGAVTAKPQMDAGELTAFVQASRALGKQTMVHCSGRDGVENCLAARVDSIEHGYFVDDDQLSRMRDFDIAWVPTFAPVQFQVDHAEELGWSDTIRDNLRRILEGHARSLVRAAELGVRVVAGSDSGSHGVRHGWGFLEELVLMQRAGLSATRVLHSATGAAGERLGFDERIGALTPGTPARFILTLTRVLTDVAELQEAKCVIFDGTVHTRGDDASVPGL